MGTSSIAMFMSLCLCLSTNGDPGESGFAKKNRANSSTHYRRRQMVSDLGWVVFVLEC